MGPTLLRRFLRSPLGVAALGFLVVVVVAAVGASVLAPYGPLEAQFTEVLKGPSSAHLLGTDSLGRDVLSRLMYGARPSLAGAGEAIGTAVVLGVPLGLIVGFVGGWADTLGGRVADLLLAVPQIMVLLMALSVFGNNMNAVMVALGVLFAPGVFRVVRGAVLEARESLYVTAASAMGLSAVQNLRRHIIRAVAGPVVVNVSLLAAVAILAETGLQFLGLGVQEPSPSWGGMVQEASQEFQQQAWLLIPSGFAIFLTVLALVVLGDTVQGLLAESRPKPKSMSKPGSVRGRSPAVTAPAMAIEVLSADTLLRVSDLTVTMPAPAGGDVTVLENVSFDVGRGEIVGLVGESGSGKTLTAMSVLALLPRGGAIVSGSCVFDGRDLVGLSDSQMGSIRGARIGLVSQEPMASLDPCYTVGAQLVEAVRRHTGWGRKAAWNRALELLELVEVPNPAELARRYPHQISGGLAQRVVIARALSAGPDLLIADEPTTALDVTVQAEVLDVLRKLRQERGMAILLVTHDWGVVADICDRSVVMYSGQVVEDGGVQDLFADPQHPYTYGLLRSDPHRVTSGGSLSPIGGSVAVPGEWPSGCRFAPRCPFVSADCVDEAVDLLPVRSGHTSRCLHHERVPVAAE